MSIFSKIFGTHNDRELKKIEVIANKVEALSDKYAQMTNVELKACTELFKERLAKGETLDDILPDAFACVREAGARVLSMRHYHCQIIGGIVLHQGRIAEMYTGEGKTLVATLPCYLNALSGKGVHVVTVNDYLAKRDAEWMGNIYRFLGLTVGVIVPQMSSQQKKEAYNADITYCTNNELGFDYLRDNMQVIKEGKVQRDLNFAIVDEVDSILIDEARTPLIISDKAKESDDRYLKKVDSFVRTLREDEYEMDEKENTISLNEDGTDRAIRHFQIDENNTNYVQLINDIDTALRAHHLLKKEVDYAVVDNEVIIIDEFTGRYMIGRRYSGSLHQAIEIKEHIPSKNENKTVASITFQNLFRLYSKLSGMTGTAKTEEEEFRSIYYLDVVTIPPNKPLIRIDEQDHLYKTEAGKYRAIVNSIKDCYSKKRPVLVGTKSVEKSQELSAIITREGIPHNVLNAKNHTKEAQIIAQAGRLGQVTIATNMAGRGTDITLGGNPEFLAKQKMLNELNYRPDVVNIVNAAVDNTLSSIALHHNFYVNMLKDVSAYPEQAALKTIIDKLFLSETSKEYYSIAMLCINGGYSPLQIDSALFPKHNLSELLKKFPNRLDRYYLTAKYIMTVEMNFSSDYVEKLRYVRKSKANENDSQEIKDARLFEELYQEAKLFDRITAGYESLQRRINKLLEFEALYEEYAIKYGFDKNASFDSVNEKGETFESFISQNVEYYTKFNVLFFKRTTLEELNGILLGGRNLTPEEKELLTFHNDRRDYFQSLVDAKKVYQKIYDEMKQLTDAEKQEVIQKGGLMIIGTERHDNRRIDNQLRGRAGRQGDPGQSAFYISTEDDLARIYGGDKLYSAMNRFSTDEDVPISYGVITKAIERAQKAIEERHFSIRKNVLAYDEVMNKQREVIYSERNKVLTGEDVHDQIIGYVSDYVRNIVNKYADLKQDYYIWNYAALNKELEHLLLPANSNVANAELAKGFNVNNLVDKISEAVVANYETFIDYFNANIDGYRQILRAPGINDFSDLERMTLLRVVDKYWMQQLDDMDILRQGIGLRALGQKDPVIAYAQEGYDLFEEMIANISTDTVTEIFKYTKKGDISLKTQTVINMNKVGRNDLCPCGSGKKYKNCCGRK